MIGRIEANAETGCDGCRDGGSCGERRADSGQGKEPRHTVGVIGREVTRFRYVGFGTNGLYNASLLHSGIDDHMHPSTGDLDLNPITAHSLRLPLLFS